VLGLELNSEPVQAPELGVLKALLAPQLEPPQAPAEFSVSVAWFTSERYTGLAADDLQLHFQIFSIINRN